MKVDAVIVGGGLMGASTALCLARAGRQVVVVEQDTPGRRASGVNAGGLRRLNRDPAEIPLAVAAAERWRNIRSLLGDDCGVKLSGQLRVAENADDLGMLEARAQLVRSLGYAHEQLIGRDQLYRLAPALARHCVGALYVEDDGFALPYHTLSAFRRRAESFGARFVSGERVTSIHRQGDSWRVTTPSRWFDGEVAVNTAGAWAAHICEGLGEPVPAVVGAPMLMITERLPRFLEPVVGAASRKLSFKQMHNGTVLIGGDLRAGCDMERERTEIDLAQLRESSRTILDLFPHMGGARIVRIWDGFEAYTPDRLPVIGPSSTASGVFHAFGFSAHGFQLSPVVGEILAEVILQGRSTLPIAAFSINRFRSPQASPEACSPGYACRSSTG